MPNNECFADTLEVQGMSYRYYPVSAIEGHERLPYALTVLLENVLRNAEDEQAARDLAERIVAALRVCCFRTLPACRYSWTLRSCARRARSWGATRRVSTRRFPAIW